MKTKKPKGYIIHADSWRVCILTLESSNRKTGNMAQLWILNRRENPVQSISEGTDSRVCGDCPLRGDGGKQRACYVNVGQAPLGVWTAWRAGSYAHGMPPAEILAGRKIRFGAYGDPVHVPLSKLQWLADHSAGWTGYSHQWRNPLLQGFRALVMASCETEADAREAWKAGWRTFRISDNAIEGEIECPSERGVQCLDCKLCAGTSRRAKSIYIPAHGTGKNFVPTM